MKTKKGIVYVHEQTGLSMKIFSNKSGCGEKLNR
jgi:hypothetical protein